MVFVGKDCYYIHLSCTDIPRGAASYPSVVANEVSIPLELLRTL